MNVERWLPPKEKDGSDVEQEELQQVEQFPASKAAPKAKDDYGQVGELFLDEDDEGRDDDERDKKAHRPVKGYNDTAYAEAFARRLGHKLRYDHKQGRWLHLEKHHWAPDSDGVVHRIATWFVKWKLMEAVESGAKERVEAAAKFLGNARQRTLIEAATNKIPLADNGENWDSTPYLLGVGNGVIDVRTGQLRDGQPEDRITLWTDVEWDANAACPRFEQFIREVFAKADGEPDQELEAYIQCALGYSLTGETSEQALFLCKGTLHGANGKGTLFRALEAVVSRYVVVLPFATLAGVGQPKFREPAYELARLPGRRIVLSSETEGGSWFKTDRIKALTGQDTISVRAIYGKPFETRPIAKYWLAVNEAPTAPKKDEAFFRRLRVVPFDHEFQPHPTLDEELREEAKGILQWLVAGAVRWYQARSLEPTPKRVELAIESYRRGLDGLEEYFEARLELDPQGRGMIDRTALKADYVAWCEENGFEQIKGLVAALKDRGLRLSTRHEPAGPDGKERKPQVWRGVRFKDE